MAGELKIDAAQVDLKGKELQAKVDELEKIAQGLYDLPGSFHFGEFNEGKQLAATARQKVDQLTEAIGAAGTMCWDLGEAVMAAAKLLSDTDKANDAEALDGIVRAASGGAGPTSSDKSGSGNSGSDKSGGKSGSGN